MKTTTIGARVWRVASFILRYGLAVFVGFLLPLVSAVAASKGGIKPLPVDGTVPAAGSGWRDRAAAWVCRTLDSAAGELDD